MGMRIIGPQGWQYQQTKFGSLVFFVFGYFGIMAKNLAKMAIEILTKFPLNFDMLLNFHEITVKTEHLQYTKPPLKLLPSSPIYLLNHQFPFKHIIAVKFSQETRKFRFFS